MNLKIMIFPWQKMLLLIKFFLVVRSMQYYSFPNSSKATKSSGIKKGKLLLFFYTLFKTSNFSEISSNLKFGFISKTFLTIFIIPVSGPLPSSSG